MPQTNENNKSSPLVSVEWLAENIQNNDLIIMDASWHMPNTGRSGLEEYKAAHIQGAIFFDIDDIKDKNCDLPHMAPDASQFENQISALGISNEKIIIVYDTHGIFTAPRAWWHFRYMGHKNIYILDGGLKKWLAAGHTVTSEEPRINTGDFKAKLNPNLIRDFNQILNYAEAKDVQILDARSSPRFRGLEPEPRAGLKSGHIKGSINIHYASLIQENGTMKPKAELEAIFAQSSINLGKPIVASCGSGVTACIIALALEIVGKKDIPIYDGSWSEWGSREGAIIESENL